MPDLFGWASATPAPAPKTVHRPPEAVHRPPETRTPPTPPASPARAPERLAGTTDHPFWPRTMPTAELLADPAFCALFDAVRPWTIGVPHNGTMTHAFAATEHVLHLLSALRGRGLLGQAPSANQTAPLPAEDLAAIVDRAVVQSGGAGGYSHTYAVARSAAAVLRALPDYELWLDGPGDVRRSMGGSHTLAHALQRLGEDSARA